MHALPGSTAEIGLMVKPLAEVQAGGASMVMHLNYGSDGHGYVYRAVLESRITVHVFNPKPKSKKPRRRVFCVEGVETEFLTFEEAWMAVAKIDQAKADEIAWAAAAPKKKPAYIPGMID